MVRFPRPLLAFVMLSALGSTGCIEALKLVGASLELASVIARSSSSGSSARPSSTPCCYAREDPTPVEGAVDRPISECELARGRYRETHPAEDDVPPQLRCTAEGDYPRLAATAPPGRVLLPSDGPPSLPSSPPPPPPSERTAAEPPPSPPASPEVL